MSQAVVIVGRSSRDYQRCGTVAPPSFALVNCEHCGEVMVISPSGAERLAQVKASGCRAEVICTTCALKDLKPGEFTMELSQHALEQMKKSGNARAMGEEFLRRAAAR